MLENFNLEKQVNKRVHRFLLHKATEENIESAKAKLVFNILTENVFVHLYEDQKHIRTLTIKSIAEFFGKEYDEAKVISLSNYLKKISKENNVELGRANIVICETKGELGAHLYNENKYVKRIPTVDLLTAVYQKVEKPVEIEKLVIEKDAAPAALEIAHSNPARDKHLAGLSADEKKMIRLMADIFVKSVLKRTEK